LTYSTDRHTTQCQRSSDTALPQGVLDIIVAKVARSEQREQCLLWFRDTPQLSITPPSLPCRLQLLTSLSASTLSRLKRTSHVDQVSSPSAVGVPSPARQRKVRSGEDPVKQSQPSRSVGQHQAQPRPAQSCSCRTCDKPPPWHSFGRALVCWRRARRTRATRDGGPKGEHAEEAHPIAREATDHVVFDDSSADLEEPHTTSVLDLSAAIYKHIRSNGVTKVDIGRLWALVATVSDTNAIRVQPKSAHVLHPKALDRVVLVVPARPTSNQYITNVPECPGNDIITSFLIGRSGQLLFHPDSCDTASAQLAIPARTQLRLMKDPTSDIRAIDR
jgi:hypothetical protein